MSTRTVEDYLTLPYHIEVVYDDSGESPGWFARVIELSGCLTQGETFEELLENIYEAVEACLSVDLEEINLEASDKVLEIAV